MYETLLNKMCDIYARNIKINIYYGDITNDDYMILYLSTTLSLTAGCEILGHSIIEIKAFLVIVFKVCLGRL